MMIFFNRKISAFTLAEVLITLGIIGVVAAMTIPTLISNTRSQQYRSKLKKTISTLSQAARMSQAQYGYDFAGINDVCGPNPASENPDTSMTICSILNGTLTGATYFDNAGDIPMSNKKGGKYYITPNVDGNGINDFHAYVLSDGTIVGIYKRIGENNQGCHREIGAIENYKDHTAGTVNCIGFIDVNGSSLPNKLVSCSSGADDMTKNDCIVKNDAKHMTDVYFIRFHDGIVKPASAATRYVLQTAK